MGFPDRLPQRHDAHKAVRTGKSNTSGKLSAS